MPRLTSLQTPARACIVLSLAVLPGAVALRIVAARRPDLVEKWYGQVIYPVLAGLLARVSSLVPFSIAEWALVALVLGGAVALVVLAVRVRRGRARLGPALVRVSLAALLVAGPLYLAFLLCFGLNYQRPPLAEVQGWDVAPPAPDELVAAARALASQLAELRSSLSEDEAGVLDFDPQEALSGAPVGLAAAVRRYPRLGLDVGRARPKCVVFSRAMTLVGIGGIYIPFTAEPNLNCEVPEPFLPFAASHEMIHAAGVASEAEADFLAYVACREHPQAEFRYAGRLVAMQYLRAAVGRVDPAAAQLLSREIQGGPQRDLDAQDAFWRAHRSRLQDVGDRVNDTYLKTQGVEAGIADYGRMVELIVAERRWLAGEGRGGRSE